MLHPFLTCFFPFWIYFDHLDQEILRLRKRKDKKKLARKVPQTLDLSAEVIKFSSTLPTHHNLSISQLMSPTFLLLTNMRSLSTGGGRRVPKTMLSSRFTTIIWSHNPNLFHQGTNRVVCSKHEVLRLRGGGGEESSSGDEERKMMPPPSKRLKRRRDNSPKYPGSNLEKMRQRPAPLDPPREQALEYGNMTADVIENEDGTEILSPCLDSYRRTEVQVQAVREAGDDQRKIGGGVYQKKDGSQEFLTIQKGYASKDIGLKLVNAENGHMRTSLNCFATMNYELFKFSRTGRRIRQEPPQETRTGYIWYGYGGDLSQSAGRCGVYIYCERAGERDFHFSEFGCERLSEAPGASQQMCSNMKCGVVKWHLSQKEFHYDKNGQWEEIQQNDFALVVFKTGKEELVWTEQPTVGEPVRSSWVRLENSDQFDRVLVDSGSRQRLNNFLRQKRLPPYEFPVPRYTPLVQRWQDQGVLKRQAVNSER